MDKKIPLIAVIGPTASGKTGLAVEIAKKFGGEVVSADSMQIYSELTIGTAKPTENEMCGIPHHAYEGYAQKLLEKGHKVAICEQLEDPKDVKKGIKITAGLKPAVILERRTCWSMRKGFISTLLTRSISPTV